MFLVTEEPKFRGSIGAAIEYWLICYCGLLGIGTGSEPFVASGLGTGHESLDFDGVL